MAKQALKISHEWAVFPDIEKPKSFSKTPKRLKSPDGKTVKPQLVKPEAGVIDIERVAGWAAEGATALLCNEFRAEGSCVMEAGAAADWWMEVFLNGECVFSTMDSGNVDGEFRTSKHVFDLPVKRGRNVLAVLVDSGMSGWKLVLGEPSETPHPQTPRARRMPALDLARYRRGWAELRPELDARIERCRKGACELEFADSMGTALPDVRVEIRQKTHGFVFGCNILPLGQLGPGRNELYEEAFAKLFNLATTALTWCDIEPERGKFRFDAGSKEIWRRPPLDRVLNFCRKRGIAMKGQPLLSDHWTPEWVPGGKGSFRALWTEFVKRVAGRYGDDFKAVDVANEFLGTAERVKEGNIFVPNDETIAWAFKEAEAAFPEKTILELNEMTYANEERCDGYCEMIKRAMANGAGIRAIGCQFHLFSLQRHLLWRSFTPERLLASYRKLAAFGKPLFITEATIPAVCGEDVQAEALDYFYRLWFSVPEIAGAIYWNLNDGAAWQSEGDAKGGLLDEDLREKPAFQKLYQLIHREWSTRLTLRSDAQGKLSFRGFYGKYEAAASVNGKSFPFAFEISGKCGEPNRIVVGQGD